MDASVVEAQDGNGGKGTNAAGASAAGGPTGEGDLDADAKKRQVGQIAPGNDKSFPPHFFLNFLVTLLFSKFEILKKSHADTGRIMI